VRVEQLYYQYSQNQEQVASREAELKKLNFHLNNLILENNRIESLQDAKLQEEESILNNINIIKKREEEIRLTNEKVTELTESLQKLRKELRLHKKERQEKDLLVKQLSEEKHRIILERSAQKEQEEEEKEHTSGVQIVTKPEEPEERRSLEKKNQKRKHQNKNQLFIKD